MKKTINIILGIASLGSALLSGCILLSFPTLATVENWQFLVACNVLVGFVILGLVMCLTVLNIQKFFSSAPWIVAFFVLYSVVMGLGIMTFVQIGALVGGDSFVAEYEGGCVVKRIGKRGNTRALEFNDDGKTVVIRNISSEMYRQLQGESTGFLSSRHLCTSDVRVVYLKELNIAIEIEVVDE